MNSLLDDDLTGPRPPVFWSALRTAFGRTAVWFACWLVPLGLALVVAVPWQGTFAAVLDQRYEPGTVRLFQDESFRHDHRLTFEALKSSTALAGSALALAVMLFGVFSGGGWLQVFLERTQGHSLRKFLWGGARYFWRFSRVWLLTLLTLALFSWLCQGWAWKTLMGILFGAVDGDLEVLESESSAVLVGWIQDGLYGALVAILLVWGDFTRTRIALQDSRSALWAGLCTWGLILLHPLRTLRPMALLFLLEAAFVFGLGKLSKELESGLGPESGTGVVFALFLLGQAALLLRGLTRGARYHAAAQVSKQLVPPLAQPDPWASRVGGPGGPQYPIDLNDDYGVSV